MLNTQKDTKDIFNINSLYTAIDALLFFKVKINKTQLNV